MVSLGEHWFKLRHHPVQAAAYYSRAKYAAIVAGRGSGKTLLARRRIIRALPVQCPYPDPIYFYALPTRAQAERVAWEPLKQMVPKPWIADISESKHCITTVFGSKLYLLGMDRPERAEGVQWSAGVIDESSDQKPGHFTKSLLPALSHRCRWLWRIGVPKRNGPGAASFKDFYERGIRGETVPGTNDRIESFHWKSNEIVDPGVLAFAKETLAEDDYREQYEASWETIGGTMFHAFSGENIREVNYSKDLPVIVGCDFNVSPMSWVLGHIIGDELLIFDEIRLKNTNTAATIANLAKRYGQHERGFLFFGDASSKARKTSASFTDYQQIKETELLKNVRVFFPKSNPAIVDRIAVCNSRLKNAKGERRVFIDPRCKSLISDLSTMTWKEGELTPDLSNKMLGHMADAFGYILWRLYPPRIAGEERVPKVHIGISA